MSFLCAEIWDPATEKFTVLAKMAEPRTYHSVAILLRDGRVFSGGGGLCGRCSTNHLNGQIFTPPNLYQANGQLASQPTITIGQVMATNAENFVVTANRALASIAILRLGSATHSVNSDERRIELCGPLSMACVAAADNKYTVTVPAQPGIAVPGNWMVFGIDTSGVPSKSQIIKIGSAQVGPLAAAKIANSTVNLKVASDMATTEKVSSFAALPVDPTVPTEEMTKPVGVVLS
jgi:galactose oxidase